ncbi:MAG: cytochrome c-type biogenesis protein [Gammaproteobacteria bacterium]
MKRGLITLLLALFVAAVQAADVPLGFDDPALQSRYEGLLEELRCLVCQNQSLADSHADLAQDLRNEVFRLLGEGASDADVRAFMVERYGDFVLYEPPLRTSTILLWAAPALLILTALIVMVRLARRQVAAPPALSAAERDRLERLIEADRQREP